MTPARAGASGREFSITLFTPANRVESPGRRPRTPARGCVSVPSGGGLPEEAQAAANARTSRAVKRNVVMEECAVRAGSKRGSIWLIPRTWKDSPRVRYPSLSGLVRRIRLEKRVRVQRPPMTRIVPESPDALSGVQDQAGVSLRPLLGGLHFPHGPLHSGTIDHDMGILLSGGAPLRWEDMAVTVNTPRHRSPTAALVKSRSVSAGIACNG